LPDLGCASKKQKTVDDEDGQMSQKVEYRVEAEIDQDVEAGQGLMQFNIIIFFLNLYINCYITQCCHCTLYSDINISLKKKEQS